MYLLVQLLPCIDSESMKEGIENGTFSPRAMCSAK